MLFRSNSNFFQIFGNRFKFESNRLNREEAAHTQRSENIYTRRGEQKAKTKITQTMLFYGCSILYLFGTMAEGFIVDSRNVCEEYKY